jgi:hypothetical protein
MSYTNSDGTYVLTGTDQGTVLLQGTTEDIVRRSLVIDIDFTQLATTFTSASLNPQWPAIPANAFITNATLIMSTAATSGGAATLDIGTYLSNGTAVAAQGITAASAITTIDAIGEVLKCAGTQVNGTVTVGTSPVYIGCKWGTAAFTAGAGKLVIDYIQT